MKKILLALLLFSVACKKDPQVVHQPSAIIESYLMPGKPVFVKINWQIPWGARQDTLVPIENLSPVLIQNQTVHPLTYIRQGVYGNPNIQIQENDSCYLYFEHNGKAVTAHTVIPGKPTGLVCNTDTVINVNGTEIFTPVAIEFKWNNPGNDYHLIVMRVRFSVLWWQEPDANFFTNYVYAGKPTQEPVSWFRCEDYFSAGRYTMELYRIQPEFAIMFNETHSSLLNITKPPHNITNAYGIFTGMNVADSVKIFVKSR